VPESTTRTAETEPAAAAAPPKKRPPAPEASRDPMTALVRVTGKRNGVTKQANGFVVMIRRDLRDTYIVTTGDLIGADDLQVTFAVDGGHAVPARYSGESHGSGEGIYLIRIDGEIPKAATYLELSESAPQADRPVQVVGVTDGGQPKAVERRYVGPKITAPFLLDLEGGAGPDLLGGPMIVDGMAGGVVVKNSDSGAVVYSVDQIRNLFRSLKLFEDPAVSK
jgi:hypothetical protein